MRSTSAAHPAAELQIRLQASSTFSADYYHTLRLSYCICAPPSGARGGRADQSSGNRCLPALIPGLGD
jgi:hypothetical protein